MSDQTPYGRPWSQGQPPPPPAEGPSQQPPQQPWTPRTAQQGPGGPPPPGGGGGTNGLSVAALIVGILALCLPVVGLLAGIVAIILGFIGRRQAAQRGQGGRGMAIAGIVLGIIGVLAWLAFLVFGVIFGNVLEDALKDKASVRIEAAASDCYHARVTAVPEEGQAQTTEHDACGPSNFDLGTRAGSSITVTKRSGTGPVTVVMLVKGEERDRDTVTSPGDSVFATPLFD